MKNYYTLLGLNTAGRWEIMFGDYDKEVVEQEKQDHKDMVTDYKKFKIVNVGDLQKDIDTTMMEMNAKYDAQVFKDAYMIVRYGDGDYAIADRNYVQLSTQTNLALIIISHKESIQDWDEYKYAGRSGEARWFECEMDGHKITERQEKVVLDIMGGF